MIPLIGYPSASTSGCFLLFSGAVSLRYCSRNTYINRKLLEDLREKLGLVIMDIQLQFIYIFILCLAEVNHYNKENCSA